MQSQTGRQPKAGKRRQMQVVIAACQRKLGNFLDKEIEKGKNNKTGGSDGIVYELRKYGGSGMINLLEQ